MKVFALTIYETTATANPQLVYPYQLTFFPYYQPAPAPYYQTAPHQKKTALDSYFRRYFDPYLSQEQNYYGYYFQYLFQFYFFKSSYFKGLTNWLTTSRQIIHTSICVRNHFTLNNLHCIFCCKFVIMIISIVSRVCPTAATIFPCTCQRKKDPGDILVVYGAISCPEGQTAATIQQILGRISAGLNIKTVALQLNRGATVANSVPAAFTSNYPKATISIVNPTDPNQCIDSTLLAPCTCSPSTTTCPSGTTVAEIQAVYSKIAPKTNLGNVVLNFPAASLTTIPTSLLGTNAATTIELIGPNTVNKSILLVYTNTHKIIVKMLDCYS